MRVGLIRHFPVEEPMPGGWLDAEELHRWQARYDEAAVRAIEAAIDSGSWQRCIASDLERAHFTARALYPGEIVTTPLLREPQLGKFGTGGLRLPFRIWKLVLRVAWLTGHRSQRASRDDFMRRVTLAADMIEAGEGDVLVVSHGGMMHFLRRELVRRGFEGDRFRVAAHARLYVLARSAREGKR